MKHLIPLFYLTDFAEELRFYLIHMTEVREKMGCVWKKMRQGNGQKEGLIWAAYSVC